MSTKILDIDTPIISVTEVNRFIRDCMVAVGASLKNAQIVAANMSQTDYRGYYSHGMNRLEKYINDIQEGRCDPTAEPIILRQNAATAWVDGRNGLGAVVGEYCMELAVQKAIRSGIGMVAAKGSNHYGICSIYTLQAVSRGLLGFTCTNTSPIMVPTRAKDSALGTNPLSFGAPGLENDSFVLDMATTAVAIGKIDLMKSRGQPILPGWALDDDGNVTTDVEVASSTRKMLPLGGTEENSGHKGTGLGMLVEILCGILADSDYGPNIRKWSESGKEANLGQCFMVIDPKCFAPGFEGRLQDFIDLIRNLTPVNPDRPVLISGDPERLHMKCVDENKGLRYTQTQLDTWESLGLVLNVKPLEPIVGVPKKTCQCTYKKI